MTLLRGDPRQAAPELAGHREFIRLTDLLTGAVAQALNGPAPQQVKLDLGQMAAGWTWTALFAHGRWLVRCARATRASSDRAGRSNRPLCIFGIQPFH